MAQLNNTNINGVLSVSGDIVANGKILQDSNGNIDIPVNKLASARTISLTGGVTGSADFDGSSNISITTSVRNDSHNHTTSISTTTESNVTPLSHNTKYKLTAGGTSVNFQLPEDTKVTQAYTIDNKTYPILMSAINDITSELSRNNETTVLNNKFYINPSVNTLFTPCISAGIITSNSAYKSTPLTIMDNSTDKNGIFLNSNSNISLACIGEIIISQVNEKSETQNIRFPKMEGNVILDTSDLNASKLASGTIPIERIPTGKESTQVALGNHTHPISIIETSTEASQLEFLQQTKYKITAGGNSLVFTMPENKNTTYSFESGTTNGTISVKASDADKATEVSVKGLGSAAYTESSAYAGSGHTHTTNIEEEFNIDSNITLAYDKKYKLSSGETSIVFTMPSFLSEIKKYTLSQPTIFIPELIDNELLDINETNSINTLKVDFKLPTTKSEILYYYVGVECININNNERFIEVFQIDGSDEIAGSKTILIKNVIKSSGIKDGAKYKVKAFICGGELLTSPYSEEKIFEYVDFVEHAISTTVNNESCYLTKIESMQPYYDFPVESAHFRYGSVEINNKTYSMLKNPISFEINGTSYCNALKSPSILFEKIDGKLKISLTSLRGDYTEILGPNILWGEMPDVNKIWKIKNNEFIPSDKDSLLFCKWFNSYFLRDDGQYVEDNPEFRFIRPVMRTFKNKLDYLNYEDGSIEEDIKFRIYPYMINSQNYYEYNKMRLAFPYAYTHDYSCHLYTGTVEQPFAIVSEGYTEWKDLFNIEFRGVNIVSAKFYEWLDKNTYVGKDYKVFINPYESDLNDGIKYSFKDTIRTTVDDYRFNYLYDDEIKKIYFYLNIAYCSQIFSGLSINYNSSDNYLRVIDKNGNIQGAISNENRKIR